MAERFTWTSVVPAGVAGYGAYYFALNKALAEIEERVRYESWLVQLKNGTVIARDESGKIRYKSSKADEVIQKALDSWPSVLLASGRYRLYRDVTVKGGSFIGVGMPWLTGGYGIVVQGGSLVSGIHIDKPANYGINVQGGGVTIQGCYIEQPELDGIYINGDAGAENFYERNVVQSAGRYGINLERSGTSDVGGHYFLHNLIGNTVETMLCKAGARFYAPMHSASYVWWLGNVIDSIRDGPAILCEGVTPLNLEGWNWVTTLKSGIPIIDIKNCDRFVCKDATILGPSGNTGVIFRGTCDVVFIDGVFARGLAKLMDKETGAFLPNLIIGPLGYIDMDGASTGVDARLMLDGLVIASTAGDAAGYIIVRINGTDYKIPIYAIS